MNLRKDHYRNFLRINFRRKKAKDAFTCVSRLDGQGCSLGLVCSAVGKAASGALVPGCPLLPAAAYNPRSRVPQTQWGLAETRCSPGWDASVITFISVSRGTCPGTLRFGESTDSTRSHAMFFLRPPVLCDGSKRQTTAFQQVFPPGESAP